MASFKDLINQHSPLPDKSVDLLLGKFTELSYPKGAQIIEKGALDKYVYFVAEGLTRSYVLQDGKDYSVWFSKPGEPVLMTMGMKAHIYSIVNVETIEDSILMRISREELENLFSTDLEICNWGRHLADTYLCELENLLARVLCLPASERYKYLLEESPELLQKVPLKHLASYILVTPESLSRIRHSLSKKSD